LTRVGEAGSSGPDVRSDARIRVELTKSGGRTIELTSRVESLYGKAIRRQLEEGCAALGVQHARIGVVDAGALPFVLAARLEAAVRAADPELRRSWLPEMLPSNTGPSEKERFRRSRLYVPGSTPKFMINAALHRPDGVILDLEDSVAEAEKPAARVLVRNALRFLDWGSSERMVRINQGERGLADLSFVVGHGAQMILLPKAESAAEVVAVAEEAARLAGGAQPPWLMPILESARGIGQAFAIATAHPTVAALTIGLEDYTADVGAVRTPEGEESLWARSAVVAAARAAGVQPIDSVHSDFADLPGLAAATRASRALGFEGKGCIHPRQIAVVHDALAPAAEELARAKEIVRAWDAAAREGKGVVSLGTKMIDPPVVKRAQRAVDLAVRTGRLDPAWRDANGRD
jgi:citrate lyase subunit beta/citryl-CoA lyase